MNDQQLEDFDAPEADPIAVILTEAESLEFQGMPVMMTDAAMMGAQSIGLKLFNLDEEKLLDSDNIYSGQLSDAIITIFFCLCATNAGENLPGDKDPKWKKILRKRTIGRAAMRPGLFEQTLVEFADDFDVATNMVETFELFNSLWNHVFKTEVEPEREGKASESRGKHQSGPPDGSPSPARSTDADTKRLETESQHVPST